jgi:hypothetical protein
MFQRKLIPTSNNPSNHHNYNNNNNSNNKSQQQQHLLSQKLSTIIHIIHSTSWSFQFFLTCWIILLLLGEIGVWMHPLPLGKDESSCQWKSGSTYRLAIIADPQLTDYYSYGMAKNSFKLKLVQYFSDLYMARAYRALIRHLNPDKVMLLGDIFDGGRILDQQEFNEHVKRLNWIFPDWAKRFEFTLGNHDVGVGEYFSVEALTRFEETFGPSNDIFPLTTGVDGIHLNVQVLIPSTNPEALNNLDLIEKKTNTEYFVKRAIGSSDKYILFSHIPLFREPNSDCHGWRNPSRHQHPHHVETSLVQGSGISYQNMLDYDTSRNLLEIIRPIAVFSGDDHLGCKFGHVIGKSTVYEYTFGTFSWLQGMIVPSVGLVSIFSNGNGDSSDSSVNMEHFEPYVEASMCDLPIQSRIYTVYGIFAFISLISLCIIHGRNSSSSNNKMRDLSMILILLISEVLALFIVLNFISLIVI